MNQGYKIFWQGKDDSEFLINRDKRSKWKHGLRKFCSFVKNQPGLEGNDDPT